MNQICDIVALVADWLHRRIASVVGKHARLERSVRTELRVSGLIVAALRAAGSKDACQSSAACQRHAAMALRLLAKSHGCAQRLIRNQTP
jgi:hypothetical protein